MKRYTFVLKLALGDEVGAPRELGSFLPSFYSQISNSELDLIMKEKGIVAGAAGGVSIEQFLQILR